MTLFAAGGLFFNEWYWEPIFRALIALPLLGIVAFVTAFAVRRWVRPLGQRVLLAVGIIVGGTALILGGGLFIASGQHARESRVIARKIDFTTYEPRSLPPRFALDSATAAAGRDAPAIHADYDAEPGLLSTTQERPPGERRTRFAGRCLLEGLSNPCREVRSPKGIRVMLAQPSSISLEASALLGGTLVSVWTTAVTEAEVLTYFDALQPVEPDELEFKRG